MDGSLERLRGTRQRPRRSRSGEATLAVGTAARCAPAWIAMAVASTVAAAAPGPAPRAVSPGTEQGAAIGDGCPTFSWAAIEGASAYELVVYRVGGDIGGDIGELGVVASPTLAERIPGGALGWTPPLERCFERGAPHAWSVRAELEDGVSEWATPLFFTVAAEPSPVELAAALDVVRRYLAGVEHGERAVSDAPVGANEPPRALERSSEIGMPAETAPDVAGGRLVRQPSAGSVGAPAGKMTVVGEVRTIDDGGEARLWGRGRPGTGVYAKPISPGTHHCFNPATGLTYGLSWQTGHWGSAADACPAGTWVCRIEDIVGCDTERPDTVDADALRCDGIGVDRSANDHWGWLANTLADPPTSLLNRAFAKSETGTTYGVTSCITLPVWCCWE